MTKTKRVCCDFCGKSSSSHRYETRQNKQEHEPLESQLKRLRLLTRRMTGKDLSGLSFHELQSLRSHLTDALVIVSNQKEKMLEFEMQFFKPPTNRVKDKKASSREKQDDEAPPKKSEREIEYERRKAESMESEVERLWLLKERMSGRELDDMSFSELCILDDHLSNGLIALYPYATGLSYLLSL